MLDTDNAQPPYPLPLRLVAATDSGRRRKTNQDRFLIDTESGVVVLADGMGGHRAGELAAQIATERLGSTLRASSPQAWSSEHMALAFEEANAAIFARAQDPSNKGMGTTAIAALIAGDRLIAGHVGDSRLYRYRGGALEQLTRDHSMLQDLIDKGFYTERDSRETGLGHVLTRSLGTQAAVAVDAVESDLRSGDVFLFCSDGLSDYVDDWQIDDTLAECRGDLDRSCQKLIDHANRNGGADNITVVLARCGD